MWCGWGGVRESGEQHTMRTYSRNIHIYLPPDRERIAIRVSCVQHPLYLKTYLCDVLCVCDVIKGVVWWGGVRESGEQHTMRTYPIIVNTKYPPPDRKRIAICVSCVHTRSTLKTYCILKSSLNMLFLLSFSISISISLSSSSSSVAVCTPSTVCVCVCLPECVGA